MLEEQLKRIADALELISKRLSLSIPTNVPLESEIGKHKIINKAVESLSREEIKKELTKLGVEYNVRAPLDYLKKLLNEKMKKITTNLVETEKITPSLEKEENTVIEEKKENTVIEEKEENTVIEEKEENTVIEEKEVSLEEIRTLFEQYIIHLNQKEVPGITERIKNLLKSFNVEKVSELTPEKRILLAEELRKDMGNE